MSQILLAETFGKAGRHLEMLKKIKDSLESLSSRSKQLCVSVSQLALPPEDLSQGRGLLCRCKQSARCSMLVAQYV